MADLYKNRYCRGDNSSCARFMIVSGMGREHVPMDLFPNQADRARKILSAR